VPPVDKVAAAGEIVSTTAPGAAVGDPALEEFAVVGVDPALEAVPALEGDPVGEFAVFAVAEVELADSVELPDGLAARALPPQFNVANVKLAIKAIRPVMRKNFISSPLQRVVETPAPGHKKSGHAKRARFAS